MLHRWRSLSSFARRSMKALHSLYVVYQLIMQIGTDPQAQASAQQALLTFAEQPDCVDKSRYCGL